MRPSPSAEPLGRRLLVPQTSFLGDVVLTTPLLRALRARLRPAHLTVLVRPEAAPLLAGHPDVDRVLVDDKRGRDRGVAGLVRTAVRLRRERFDLAVSPHRSLRTALVLAAAGIPHRVGFRDGPGAALYHVRVPRDPSRHAVERNLALLAPFGGASGAPRLHLAVDPEAARRVAALLPPGAGPLVGIAPGSVWATKRWTVEGFARVAAALVADGARCVILGAAEDRARAEAIRAQSGGRAVVLAGRTDVAGLVALIDRLSLLIGNDSAPMHVASARGVPVVAVFGAPTRRARARSGERHGRRGAPSGRDRRGGACRGAARPRARLGCVGRGATGARPRGVGGWRAPRRCAAHREGGCGRRACARPVAPPPARGRGGAASARRRDRRCCCGTAARLPDCRGARWPAGPAAAARGHGAACAARGGARRPRGRPRARACQRCPGWPAARADCAYPGGPRGGGRAARRGEHRARTSPLRRRGAGAWAAVARRGGEDGCAGARRARGRSSRLGALDPRRARRLRVGCGLCQALGARAMPADGPLMLPSGYTLLTTASVRAAVRADLAAVLGPWLLAPVLVPPADAEPIASGRGSAYRAVLPGGVRAVVRPYRRGGLLGRVVHETYLGWRPRPLRELALTVEARRRGVAAAEVLAARIEGRLAYRGALVTAEVPGAVPLIEALRAAPDAATRRHLGALAGSVVAALHTAGVLHADLNLTNILVGADGRGATVIDLDRGRLVSGRLGARARRRSLRRLLRSARALDPVGQAIDRTVRAGFREGYARVAGRPCGC